MTNKINVVTCIDFAKDQFIIDRVVLQEANEFHRELNEYIFRIVLADGEEVTSYKCTNKREAFQELHLALLADHI
jgi:hypothetical protein